MSDTNDHEPQAAVCDICGRARIPEDKEYNVTWFFINFGTDDNPGWYSGKDGEICGQDMLKLYKRANGLL